MQTQKKLSLDNIVIQEVVDGNIEPCRELCNELMAFQKSQAVIMKENFDAMNFDTRMKPAYEKADTKQVLIAYHGDAPVGYIFSTVEECLPNDKRAMPPQIQENPNIYGFYGPWLPEPKRVGHVSNLYLKPEYRSTGLGNLLISKALAWFEEFEDVYAYAIHVSNGNKNAMRFYEKHGFQFSHDVLGGFIQEMYKPLSA